MKKLNKKGFTLIELMAVVIVLILIIFLALNKVNKSSKRAKLDAIKAGAINYVKSFKDLLGEDLADNENFGDGYYSIDKIEQYGLKLTGKKPDQGYFLVKEYTVLSYCLMYDSYFITDVEAKNPVKKGSCNFDRPMGEFSYSGEAEKFTVEYAGKYKIELWGAQGGSGSLVAGGAYTSGEIELESGDELYFYIGQMTNGFSSTFNGGGGCSNNCSGAGGATDVRLVGGSWNDPTGLKSRIMVAAGGGGYNSYQSKYPGGPGGTLIGISGSGDSPRTGGSQTTGGVGNAASRNGSFGIGGYGDNWGGGGGGGYWGGAGGNNSSTGNGGSSGSSFISGHLGCVAILSDSSLSPRNDSNEVACADGTTDITCSYHYSGKIFTNTVMIAGNQSMPTHDGSSTMTGNKDNGYAKITLVG